MSNLARKNYNDFDSEDKNVKNWADSAQIFVNNNIETDKSKTETLPAVNIPKQDKNKLLKSFIKFIYNHGWKNQHWAWRLAILGFVAGLLEGGRRVGIATSGWGIGVPIALLTSAGGAFLGMFVDKFMKSIKNGKDQ